MTDSRYIEASFRIGSHLARDALWDGGRCTWFAPVLDDFGNGQSLGCGTLGASLYEGTAGIGLFLAELAAATGDGVIAGTALGAFEHALGQAERLPEAVHGGFYTGLFGVGFAAARAGRLLGRPALVESGLGLVARAAAPPERDAGSFDIMSGAAGAIPVLLRLAAAHGRADFVEAAAWRAEALVDAGSRSERGLSWNTMAGVAAALGSAALPPNFATPPGADGMPHLTGYSHGTAGIALALLEFGTVTGDARYLEAARDAFAYEDSWFASAGGYWPDLRFHRPGEASAPPPCAWCHGAIGIGLARARAYALTGDVGHRDAFDAAMALAGGPVTARLEAEDADFSPCHGLAGDAELFIARSRLEGEGGSAASMVTAIADHGLETYSEAKRPWPCGVPGAQHSPSLMTGMAGTGYFYLRAADPAATPSILLVEAR